jgi:hypothetical protein
MHTLPADTRSAKTAPAYTAALMKAAAEHNSNPAYSAAGYSKIAPFRATISLPSGDLIVEFNATPGKEHNRLVAIDARARDAIRRGQEIKIERIAPAPRPVPTIVLDLTTIRQQLRSYYVRVADPSPAEGRDWDHLEDRRQSVEAELDAAVVAAIGVPLATLISAREG